MQRQKRRVRKRARIEAELKQYGLRQEEKRQKRRSAHATRACSACAMSTRMNAGSGLRAHASNLASMCMCRTTTFDDESVASNHLMAVQLFV